MTSFGQHHPSPASAGPASILVVDDMEANRYLTSSWLRRNGYRVQEAATGGEALDIIHRMPLDLILLDVNLPDMSGYEVCEQVKGDPRTAALPVIHMSATAIESDDRTEGLARGADGYLVEPIDPNELVATVEAALRYHRARAEAVRFAYRLTQLTEVTLAVNSASSFDTLLTAATAGAAAIFGVPVTVLTETPRDGLRAATLDSGPDVTLHTEPPGVLSAFGSDADDEIRPRITNTTALSWHPGDDATVIVTRPVRSQSPVYIALAPDSLTTQEDRNLLVQLSQATALACESLRSLSEEHALALTLQRSLLPQHLPVHPALEVAARYAPASDNAEIGGDFYEVAEIDGRMLIAVGDVAGHSIEAATVMGEVRHALRAYAIEGHEPVAILDRLNQMLRRFHPRDLTTLCLVSVDTAAGTTQIANAGHIPPLLVDEHGGRYIPARGPILGIQVPRPAPTTLILPPGALMLLVTDGLIERRNHSIDDGMDALQAEVSTFAATDDLETLCDTLLDRFGQKAQDDIALLAFRRR